MTTTSPIFRSFLPGMAKVPKNFAELEEQAFCPPRYKPPKITAIHSPNPNIKNERIVIQVRTLFDTDFASPSIPGLLVRCAAPVRSLGE
jgi:hypothetical protein